MAYKSCSLLLGGVRREIHTLFNQFVQANKKYMSSPFYEAMRPANSSLMSDAYKMIQADDALEDYIKKLSKTVKESSTNNYQTILTLREMFADLVGQMQGASVDSYVSVSEIMRAAIEDAFQHKFTRKFVNDILDGKGGEQALEVLDYIRFSHSDFHADDFLKRLGQKFSPLDVRVALSPRKELLHNIKKGGLVNNFDLQLERQYADAVAAAFTKTIPNPPKTLGEYQTAWDAFVKTHPDTMLKDFRIFPSTLIKDIIPDSRSAVAIAERISNGDIRILPTNRPQFENVYHTNLKTNPDASEVMFTPESFSRFIGERLNDTFVKKTAGRLYEDLPNASNAQFYSLPFNLTQYRDGPITLRSFDYPTAYQMFGDKLEYTFVPAARRVSLTQNITELGYTSTGKNASVLATKNFGKKIATKIASLTSDPKRIPQGIIDMLHRKYDVVTQDIVQKELAALSDEGKANFTQAIYMQTYKELAKDLTGSSLEQLVEHGDTTLKNVLIGYSHTGRYGRMVHDLFSRLPDGVLQKSLPIRPFVITERIFETYDETIEASLMLQGSKIPTGNNEIFKKLETASPEQYQKMWSKLIDSAPIAYIDYLVKHEIFHERLTVKDIAEFPNYIQQFLIPSVDTYLISNLFNTLQKTLAGTNYENVINKGIDKLDAYVKAMYTSLHTNDTINEFYSFSFLKHLKDIPASAREALSHFNKSQVRRIAENVRRLVDAGNDFSTVENARTSLFAVLREHEGIDKMLDAARQISSEEVQVRTYTDEGGDFAGGNVLKSTEEMLMTFIDNTIMRIRDSKDLENADALWMKNNVPGAISKDIVITQPLTSQLIAVHPANQAIVFKEAVETFPTRAEKPFSFDVHKMEGENQFTGKKKQGVRLEVEPINDIQNAFRPATGVSSIYPLVNAQYQKILNGETVSMDILEDSFLYLIREDRTGKRFLEYVRPQTGNANETFGKIINNFFYEAARLSNEGKKINQPVYSYIIHPKEIKKYEELVESYADVDTLEKNIRDVYIGQLTKQGPSMLHFAPKIQERLAQVANGDKQIIKQYMDEPNMVLFNALEDSGLRIDGINRFLTTDITAASPTPKSFLPDDNGDIFFDVTLPAKEGISYSEKEFNQMTAFYGTEEMLNRFSRVDYKGNIKYVEKGPTVRLSMNTTKTIDTIDEGDIESMMKALKAEHPDAANIVVANESQVFDKGTRLMSPSKTMIPKTDKEIPMIVSRTVEEMRTRLGLNKSTDKLVQKQLIGKEDQLVNMQTEGILENVTGLAEKSKRTIIDNNLDISTIEDICPL